MTWMRADGLWTLGAPLTEPAPLVQAVEVRGGLLTWALGSAPEASPTITVTDLTEADWLWRLVGEPAHAVLLQATGEGPIPVDPVWDEALVTSLHKVAHGWWLRRWWPASAHDGVSALPGPTLDAVLADLIDTLDCSSHHTVNAPHNSGLGRG